MHPENRPQQTAGSEDALFGVALAKEVVVGTREEEEGFRIAGVRLALGRVDLGEPGDAVRVLRGSTARSAGGNGGNRGERHGVLQ